MEYTTKVVLTAIALTISVIYFVFWLYRLLDWEDGFRWEWIPAVVGVLFTILLWS